MQSKLKAVLFAALLAFSGLALADNNSSPNTSIPKPAHEEAAKNTNPKAPPPSAAPCQMAGGRCPACCTGCGTSQEDCSACKPKALELQS